MIDFVSLQIIDINISELEKNPKLNFVTPINLKTGEMKTHNRNGKEIQLRHTAFFNELKIEFFESGFVKIDGSLHKYWNNGSHNFNDFNINNIKTVLKDIENIFNIKPEQMILRQLEIGVNIIPPQPTKEILKHCFLHKTTPFVWKFNSDEGKYIQSEHSQYIIKIYDKARHYRAKGFNISEPEIMRFEIKYRKLEKIKNLGIITIKDLLNYGLENFTNILLKEWQNVLFYDNTINHKSKLLQKYCNPLYWHDIKSNRKKYYKHKTRLNKFIEQNSENIKGQIYNRINKKCIELTQKRGHIDQRKSDKSDTLKKDQLINIKGGHIDTLYILSKRTLSKSKERRICIITGVNISMQKETSIYLSHTGLKYYYKTDKRIYNEIKSKYLSDLWQTSDYKKQIQEIAHNIRNKASNLKNKQNRLYPQEQYNLFDINKGFLPITIRERKYKELRC